MVSSKKSSRRMPVPKLARGDEAVGVDDRERITTRTCCRAAAVIRGSTAVALRQIDRELHRELAGWPLARVVEAEVEEDGAPVVGRFTPAAISTPSIGRPSRRGADGDRADVSGMLRRRAPSSRSCSPRTRGSRPRALGSASTPGAGGGPRGLHWARSLVAGGEVVAMTTSVRNRSRRAGSARRRSRGRGSRGGRRDVVGHVQAERLELEDVLGIRRSRTDLEGGALVRDRRGKRHLVEVDRERARRDSAREPAGLDPDSFALADPEVHPLAASPRSSMRRSLRSPRTRRGPSRERRDRRRGAGSGSPRRAPSSARGRCPGCRREGVSRRTPARRAARSRALASRSPTRSPARRTRRFPPEVEAPLVSSPTSLAASRGRRARPGRSCRGPGRTRARPAR